MLSSLIKNSPRRPFPNFITGSKIISSNVEIEKIFPKIGLPNSSDPIDLKLDLSGVQVDKVVHLAIKKYLEKWHEGDIALDELKSYELFKVANALYVFEELNRRFNKKGGVEDPRAAGVAVSGGKVLLTKAIQSYDGKSLIKSGTDVFQLVRHLLHYVSRYVQVDLVSPDEMYDQCKDLQIVFSSEEVDGAWDMATMSMRGIKSCMRWESRQCSALTGSIVDPCCGILYITNGEKTLYGPKMLFRALVRLAINRDNHKPIIFLDRLYSSFYKNKPDESGHLDKQIKKVFVEYLQKKVTGCQIFDAQAKGKQFLNDYMLPRPNNMNMLLQEELSYRDCPIEYSNYSYSELEKDILKTLGIAPVKAKPKAKAARTPKKPTKKAVRAVLSKIAANI